MFILKCLFTFVSSSQQDCGISHSLLFIPFQQLLLDYVLDRLCSRLENAVGRLPLDMDKLEFICSQEVVFKVLFLIQLPSHRIFWRGLSELLRLIQPKLSEGEMCKVTIVPQSGPISPYNITHLLDINCSVSTIASMIGVNTRTVFRSMAKCNLSIQARYSSLTNEELDECVKEVKQHIPH